MPKIEPVTTEELKKLMNVSTYELWQETVKLVEANYEINHVWHTGGKISSYELKLQKSGRTLISFFPKETEIGVMIIFGKKEREKVEAIRNELPAALIKTYDDAKVYHDGKWVLWTMPNPELVNHLIQLLATKRKPKKQ